MTSFIILALAIGALSMTITKTRFFRTPRRWVVDKSDFWGELIQCPYCCAHWFTFVAVAVWRPRLTDCGFWPADLLVSGFALVALSAFVAGTIYRLFTPPTIKAQDLKNLIQTSSDE